MKKLLALVLCVMLFISVFPSAALAESSGSAVDLAPAYQKLQALNVAYAQLGMATAAKNARDGWTAIAKMFKDGSFAKQVAEFAAQNYGNVSILKNILSMIEKDGHGLSYEDLFKMGNLGFSEYETYEALGIAIGADCAKAEDDLKADVIKAYDEKVAAIKADAEAAVKAMTPKMPETK